MNLDLRQIVAIFQAFRKAGPVGAGSQAIRSPSGGNGSALSVFLVV